MPRRLRTRMLCSFCLLEEGYSRFSAVRSTALSTLSPTRPRRLAAAATWRCSQVSAGLCAGMFWDMQRGVKTPGVVLHHHWKAARFVCVDCKHFKLEAETVCVSWTHVGLWGSASCSPHKHQRWAEPWWNTSLTINVIRVYYTFSCTVNTKYYYYMTLLL